MNSSQLCSGDPHDPRTKHASPSDLPPNGLLAAHITTMSSLTNKKQRKFSLRQASGKTRDPLAAKDALRDTSASRKVRQLSLSVTRASMMNGFFQFCFRTIMSIINHLTKLCLI